MNKPLLVLKIGSYIYQNNFQRGSEALASPESCEAKASLPKDNHSHVNDKNCFSFTISHVAIIGITGISRLKHNVLLFISDLFAMRHLRNLSNRLKIVIIFR